MNPGATIFLLLALVAIVGAIPPLQFSDQANKAYPLETFVKNYELINNYLEKEVATDNVGANFAKANDWLEKQKSKMSMRRNKELIAALERFTTLFKRIPDNMSMCYDIVELLHFNDKFLGNKVHLSGGNYKLTRLDRVIEQIADKSIGVCRKLAGDDSSLEFIYKKRSYDEINLLLLKNEPNNADPEANMLNVDKILKGMVSSQGEGALTEALRLLASLKSVAEKLECNDNDFKVVMKNLIASRQPTNLYQTGIQFVGQHLRRIDTVVAHYATIYTDACLDVLPQKFETLIKGLDKNTLHALRVILSESLLEHTENSDSAEAQFPSDFTTPELAENVLAISDATYPMDLKVKLRGGEFLKRVIKTLASKDPERLYLEPIIDEVQGQHIVDLNRLTYLYDMYLIGPCKKYIDVSYGMFERFRYHYARNTRKPSSLKREQVGIILGFEAYDRCMSLFKIKRDNVLQLGNTIRSNTKATFIGGAF